MDTKQQLQQQKVKTAIKTKKVSKTTSFPNFFGSIHYGKNLRRSLCLSRNFYKVNTFFVFLSENLTTDEAYRIAILSTLFY